MFFGNSFQTGLSHISPNLMRKKLQSELLPANCHLKTFEICCIKVLLRIITPLRFK